MLGPPPSRLVWGLVAALYVLCFPYHPRLRSPNELSRLLQTRALVEFGTLNLNRALQTYGPAGDLSVVGGRYYPSKAPLMSFAAVPVYALLRALGGGGPRAVSELSLVYFARLFLTVLPTLLVLVWIRRFLGVYASPPAAELATAAYALGSLAFSYSLLFMSHQPSAVLLFASFYALFRSGRGEWSWPGWLAAGAFSGGAVACEYTTVLAVLALGVYLVAAWEGTPERTVRSLLARGALVLAGALPFAVALGAYHAACFGSPFDTGYRHLADAAYQPWHLGGVLGVRTPSWEAFWKSFASPLRGLFVLAPFLLLAVPGLARLWRLRHGDAQARALAVLTGLVALAYTYFTASFSYASWGWTTGPRHLTSLVPFLLLPAALALSPRPRWPGAALVAASVLTTGLLTFVNYIPDDVSSPVHALALPLFASGDFVPSPLDAWGLTNPASGLILLGVLLAALLAVLWSCTGARTAAAGLLLGTLYVAALRVTDADSPADRGALRLLRSVWLAPPGVPVRFGPPFR